MVIFKNGTLIEPSTGFMGKMDVAVKGEKIFKIAKKIEIETQKEEMDEIDEVKVYDCSGKYIAVGYCILFERSSGK